MKSLYKTYIQIWEERLKDDSLSKKERESLEKRIKQDSMGKEYHIPTQIHAPKMFPSNNQSIKSKYEYNPTLTVTQNASLSFVAWMELKNHIQQTFLPDTYSLAPCSDTAHIYSQEFAVDI